MIIINVNINGQPVLSDKGNAEIVDFCNAIHIGPPVNVYDAGKLAETLEKNKNQKVLLFSNFAPDSSYPGSGRENRTGLELGEDYELCEVDLYSKSKSFFKTWTSKYNFRTIHFITEAAHETISNELLKSVSSTIPITVTRKSDWINSTIEFEKLYVNFMKIKIVEAASKDPFA